MRFLKHVAIDLVFIVVFLSVLHLWVVPRMYESEVQAVQVMQYLLVDCKVMPSDKCVLIAVPIITD